MITTNDSENVRGVTYYQKSDSNGPEVITKHEEVKDILFLAKFKVRHCNSKVSPFLEEVSPSNKMLSFLCKSTNF